MMSIQKTTLVLATTALPSVLIASPSIAVVPSDFMLLILFLLLPIIFIAGLIISVLYSSRINKRQKKEVESIRKFSWRMAKINSVIGIFWLVINVWTVIVDGVSIPAIIFLLSLALISFIPHYITKKAEVKYERIGDLSEN